MLKSTSDMVGLAFQMVGSAFQVVGLALRWSRQLFIGMVRSAFGMVGSITRPSAQLSDFSINQVDSEISFLALAKSSSKPCSEILYDKHQSSFCWR